ncbi:hypothetical protein ACJRO7_027482 [Eucalyptus globulus]|uniref:Uncharacterized protein n=1 Tax=Eucalyptus globulus TaxID=34317 RepID=A0ABD3JRC3_EUCGL
MRHLGAMDKQSLRPWMMEDPFQRRSRSARAAPPAPSFFIFLQPPDLGLRPSSMAIVTFVGLVLQIFESSHSWSNAFGHRGRRKVEDEVEDERTKKGRQSQR